MFFLGCGNLQISFLTKHLPIQFQQYKGSKKVWNNMFKVNNNNTRTTSLASLLLTLNIFLSLTLSIEHIFVSKVGFNLRAPCQVRFIQYYEFIRLNYLLYLQSFKPNQSVLFWLFDINSLKVRGNMVLHKIFQKILK